MAGRVASGAYRVACGTRMSEVPKRLHFPVRRRTDSSVRQEVRQIEKRRADTVVGHAVIDVCEPAVSLTPW